MRSAFALLFCAALAVGCGTPTAPETTQALADKAAKGDLSAVETLLTRLGAASSIDERGQAYRAVIEAGKKAGPVVMKFTRDSDPVRREHALALAANLKAEGAFDAAVAALGDQSFTHAHSAAWALGELGDERAIAPLADALARSKPGLTARESARALERFGGKAVGAIVSRIGMMNPDVRGYAVRVLGEMRDPAGRPSVLAALSDPTLRADALWALGTMGKELGGLSMTPYLKDSDPTVRVEACRTAGLLAERGALPLLDAMRASDPVIVVREWAARGMGLMTGDAEKYKTKAGEWKIPDMIYH